MKAFVISEHADAAAELCAGARTMADEVILVALGSVPEACANKVATITLPKGRPVDDAADTVIAYFDSEEPGMVLAEPTRRVKVIAGKLAAHCKVAVITDAMSVEGDVAKSMYFGGLGIRKQKARGKVFVLTVGKGAFGEISPSGANEPVELEWVEPACGMTLVSSSPIEKSGVDLAGAEVIVAAGRGFSEEGQLELARSLSDKIGAGLGCTRPLTEGVDWFPREAYIGVSGQMLSPKTYVGVGVSGQMQHMVGVNRAKAVFAINKDKNAPIFKQCDYGLVGDLKDVLPALNAAL